MEEIKKLEQRIAELEYRIGILENFLDQESSLHHKHDESLMNAMRIKVRKDLGTKGIKIEKGRERYGTQLYLNI
ncbi:MAG: hypothetical protein AAF990_24055, partial [Bacteroidota bacterium]